MPTTKLARVFVILVLSLGLAGRVGREATAADPSQFTTIKVAASSLRSPVFTGSGVATLADALKSITTTVNDRVCATVDLRGPSNTDSEGNKVLTLGTDDQPAACRQVGASILMFNGQGIEHAVSFTVNPGSTYTLSNLGPVPPGRSALRGFVTLTIELAGQGRIAGSGSSSELPLVSIVPLAVQQPLAPVGACLADCGPQGLGSGARSLLPTYSVEASGILSLALPAGDYLIAYPDINFQFRNAPSRVQIQTSSLLSLPAVPLHVEAGTSTSLNLVLVAEPISLAPTLSAPRVGEAGLK